MWHATAAASRKRSRKWATSLNGSTKFCKPILPGIVLVLTLHLALTLAAVAVSRVLCFIFAFAFLHLHLHVWHASANASEYATFCLPFVAALVFRMHSSDSTYIHTNKETHTLSNTLQSLSWGNNSSFHSSAFALAFVSIVLDSFLKISEHCIIYSAFAIHLLIIYPQQVKLIKLGKKYMYVSCVYKVLLCQK